MDSAVLRSQCGGGLSLCVTEDCNPPNPITQDIPMAVNIHKYTTMYYFSLTYNII